MKSVVGSPAEGRRWGEATRRVGSEGVGVVVILPLIRGTGLGVGVVVTSSGPGQQSASSSGMLSATTGTAVGVEVGVTSGVGVGVGNSSSSAKTEVFHAIPMIAATAIEKVMVVRSDGRNISLLLITVSSVHARARTTLGGTVATHVKVSGFIRRGYSILPTYAWQSGTCAARRSVRST